MIHTDIGMGVDGLLFSPTVKRDFAYPFLGEFAKRVVCGADTVTAAIIRLEHAARDDHDRQEESQKPVGIDPARLKQEELPFETIFCTVFRRLEIETFLPYPPSSLCAGHAPGRVCLSRKP